MKVTIEEHDSLVTTTTCHTRDGNGGAERFHRVLIVQQDGDSGVYATLWHSHLLSDPIEDGVITEYTLIWRGNFDKCLDNYSDIVGDLLTEVIKLPNGRGIMTLIA